MALSKPIPALDLGTPAEPQVRTKGERVILLIENDKDYIYLLEQAFRKADIQNTLKIARYGSEAILYLKGVGIYQDRRSYPLPSLILLDMTNPDGSSMAVLGWVREQRTFDGVPIVILAHAEQDSDIQRALDRGANAFIVKREQLNDLTAMINNMEICRSQTAAHGEGRTYSAFRHEARPCGK